MIQFEKIFKTEFVECTDKRCSVIMIVCLLLCGGNVGINKAVDSTNIISHPDLPQFTPIYVAIYQQILIIQANLPSYPGIIYI